MSDGKSHLRTKYAKEHFKMDTGYVQLVFDIFFDATSDGNMTDTSDIPTAEFAVYLFLLSVFKSVPSPTSCPLHSLLYTVPHHYTF